MSYVIKPGPDTGPGWALAIPVQGGGIPAQIISISNPGTSGAIATVRQLDASGLMTSAQYAGVYIFPYPEFAETGDQGMTTSYTPTSGASFSTVRYIQISKQRFMVF